MARTPTKSIVPDTSESPVSIPPKLTTRRDGWTAEKQRGFLQMLAATQSVSVAAKAVGMSRQSAYKLRARLDDAPFGAAWRMATQSARNVLVEAALDRAINGVEVPHYWQGELVGTSRRYDERLTTVLLNSGALGGARRTHNSAEDEFAHHGLDRLLDRIADGPSEWTDFPEERNYAWGDDPDSAEPARLEDEGSDQG
ncbi:MAG: hypothetical protein AAFP79_09160 [Pseudomonadota bacterium]